MSFLTNLWRKISKENQMDKEQTGKQPEESKGNYFFSDKKEKEKEFIKSIEYKNLNKSPVFLSFITIILIVNVFIFFLIIIKEKIGIEKLDSSWYELFFGANHASSVIEGKQVWRIISFPFIENVQGFQVLISAIFVGLTFYSIGFYQEVLLGSKKTLIIWATGVLIVGLTQLFLTKTESVYYYGTEYLSWITLGSLTFMVISKSIKNKQALSMVKSSLIKTVILLVIFSILKYVRVRNNLFFENNSIMPVGSYYITFTFFSFVVGFLLALLLNVEQTKESYAVYGAAVFFVILLLALLIVGFMGITTRDIGDNSWRKIQPYY